MNDFSGLPISGSLLVTGAVYVAVSMMVTGPLVAERSIEKLGWNQICKTTLRADISARKAPKPVIPKLDCRSTLGAFLPELAKICDRYGNPDFGGPATAVMQQQEKLRRELEERRLSHAASKNLSRCSCAASLVASDRVHWATYAGSMRLISPLQVRSLESELVRALHSPHCVQKG